MKVQYASDLHLERPDNSRYIKHHPLIPSAEILVLAGDIGIMGSDNFTKHPFWNFVSDNFERTLVVPGNHEFFGKYNINLVPQGEVSSIHTNVTIHYNDTIRIGDVDFILSTLWSEISVENYEDIRNIMGDFHRIYDGEKLLERQRYNQEHKLCLDYINYAVKSSNAEKIVVVSHHIPSFELVAQEYLGSIYNEAFTVELNDFIKSTHIDSWIYGHSHRNIDSTVGQTRCLSNQLGYVLQNEHTSFSHNKVIEL